MFKKERENKIREFMESLESNDSFLIIKEKFPHIAKNIALFAGYEEFSEYMNELLMDSRDGHREGFPTEICSSIFKLSSAHDDFFNGLLVKKNTNMYLEVEPKHTAWNDVTEVDREVRTLNTEQTPKVGNFYDSMAPKMGLKKKD